MNEFKIFRGNAYEIQIDETFRIYGNVRGEKRTELDCPRTYDKYLELLEMTQALYNSGAVSKYTFQVIIDRIASDILDTKPYTCVCLHGKCECLEA